jgi:hypothetical protein
MKESQENPQSGKPVKQARFDMDAPYRILQRYFVQGDVHKEPVRWCSKEFARLRDVMRQEKCNLLADIWKRELL